MRVVVRLGFGVTEPHQTAAISARESAAHAHWCVSAKIPCVGEGYFFFLPVFFFAFFAFLAMLPSATPKVVQCKSTSTCINIEYTTIAKLTVHASKKVNGGHAKRLSAKRSSLTPWRRDEHGLCSAGSRASNKFSPCRVPVDQLPVSFGQPCEAS